jgi:signal transduction histidine kinase
MADHSPDLIGNAGDLAFDADRVSAFLKTLEDIAAGHLEVRLPISPRRDTLDAIAHAINVLVGELAWAGARAKEAQETRAAELRAAVASAETRNGALLRAIPDLMFVMLRDGTYVDYHARDSSLLFSPPERFIGRNVRDILPPAPAALVMDGLERAARTDDTVVVEYELPMGEPRLYEARIVRADAGRFISTVRDVTEARRALELNRDATRRLIARQEVERQRIARELHDDVGQRVALMTIEIDGILAQVADDALRGRLRQLSGRASELTSDLHHLSYELHPSRLQTLGLVTALQALCRDTSNQHLQVTFTHDGIPPSLDAGVSLGLYRIVQEALHNVVRHSRATDAHVNVFRAGGHIGLLITDSGIGFDPRRVPPGSLGLVSMRERVAILHGQLTIDSVPGRGTRVSVLAPFPSDRPHVGTAAHSYGHGTMTLPHE